MELEARGEKIGKEMGGVWRGIGIESVIDKTNRWSS